VLMKFVLETTHVYWVSLSFAPKELLDKVRRLRFNFVGWGQFEKQIFLGILEENSCT
jgi:hypothetical protein